MNSKRDHGTFCPNLSSSFFEFLAIRCSEPEEVSNGDVDRKCQTFGCRISYSCRAGYELVGRQHRYCQADGSWSPRILPACKRKTAYNSDIVQQQDSKLKIQISAIKCDVPRDPLNGRAVYSSVSYNSLISYECNYGYMLIGDSVRRCERNKLWTGDEPHCKGTLYILLTHQATIKNRWSLFSRVVIVRPKNKKAMQH